MTFATYIIIFCAIMVAAIACGFFMALFVQNDPDERDAEASQRMKADFLQRESKWSELK